MSALRNPVLALTVGLPLAAVLASVATTFVALSHGDTQLPEQYHWEGIKLDRDFTRAQRAAELGIAARIEGLRDGGTCELHLQSRGPLPERVSLSLVHATLPALDQTLVFQRAGSKYQASCRPILDGHWRLELTDTAGGWTLRRSVYGVAESIAFDAGAKRSN